MLPTRMITLAGLGVGGTFVVVFFFKKKLFYFFFFFFFFFCFQSIVVWKILMIIGRIIE